jgi:acetylglutamate kinase
VEHDVGQVGDIVSIDPSVVKALQDDQFIPWSAPSALANTTRATTSTPTWWPAKLATVLQAEKLLMLTNIPGVLDKAGQAADRADAARIDELVPTAPSRAACCPRLPARWTLPRAGVHAVHIIDGRVPHALLLEVLGDQAFGTMIRNS